ncbi:MAG: hypothetical protein F4029_16260 [Gammaproteobacteria bacterium]|nr:hypothetical protein [Gammaproteobacteria bacterium]MXY56998.1 hypothetical protein [Gammaproteobacteria bacterium]MYF31286.1 hypothetical protein [Gammaproteobacteria bacterium]MYK47771.1 hypothetical protein [Gammaproteobacteria bacterium]
MKSLLFVAATLAVGGQAREPENLAALVDEMAVLERILGAALESETPMSGPPFPDGAPGALLDYVDRHMQPWFQTRVGTIESEYLARQGILVSLHLRRRPTVQDLPDALFTMMAQTGETGLPIPFASLPPDDLAALKILADELDETREKHRKLYQDWHVELRDASESDEFDPDDSGPIEREISALNVRERELQADIDAEIQRLRSLLVQPVKESSGDDVDGALIQAVCDYAMLKSLPDDEHLTLRVGQDTPPRDGWRAGRQWTYYVLAKPDVVECRHGSIDAEALRERAYVYSRERP